MENLDTQSTERTMRSIHHVKDFTGEEALQLMVLTPDEEKIINEACTLFLDLIYNVDKVSQTDLL